MGWYDSVRSFYYTWGSHFKGRYDKVIAYGVITLLSSFSLLDTCLMWANYRDLRSDDYRYALVTGHPGAFAVNALFTLSILSSVFCVIECVNILSMMTNGGHTRLPVELEQAAVLVCAGIPSGAVGLSVIMCRHGSATGYQMSGGLVTLVKSALRMYFYGWLKESRFKCERSPYRWTLKIAIYMTATSTWLMVFVIQCFAWQRGQTGGVHSAETGGSRLDAMRGISILLVGGRDFNHADRSRHIGSYFTHRIRYCPSANRISFSNDTGDASRTRPVLATDVSDVMASAAGYRVVYGCHGDYAGNVTLVLAPCPGNGTPSALMFRFRYERGSRRKRHQPYGEIRYNVATLIGDRCRHLDRPMKDDWQLHYFRIVRDRRLVNETDTADTAGTQDTFHGDTPAAGDTQDTHEDTQDTDNNGCVDARLEQAWVQDCFPPIPHYDHQLDVCG